LFSSSIRIALLAWKIIFTKAPIITTTSAPFPITSHLLQHPQPQIHLNIFLVVDGFDVPLSQPTCRALDVELLVGGC